MNKQERKGLNRTVRLSQKGEGAFSCPFISLINPDDVWHGKSLS